MLFSRVKKNKKRKIAALVIVAVMAVTYMPVMQDYARAETAVKDVDNVAFMVSGNIENRKGKNGFNKNFVYLTQAELDGITSEEFADKYFLSATKDTFVENLDYSAKRRNNEWYTQNLSRGLSIGAIENSLGITAGSKVSYTAIDGYCQTEISKEDFWKDRYFFATQEAAGKKVEPALALSGTYTSGDGSGQSLDVPLVMIGQTTVGDYNALYMGKQTRELIFGSEKTVLTVDNNGKTKNLSAGDIVVGEKAGASIDRKEATYSYSESGTNHEVIATGETLKALLENTEMYNEDVVFTATDADGNTKEIPANKTENYFVAYEGTCDGNKIDNTKSDLVLLCPGTAKDEVLMEGVNKLTIKTVKPAAPTTVKVANYSYNKLKVTWSKVTVANGYYIDRYNAATKKWTTKAYTVKSGNTLSWVDSSLATGTNYKYRVRAYVTEGTATVEGDNRTSGYKKPILCKAAISKLKKSGTSSVKVTWKKISGASGYVITSGRNKNFTKSKKIATVKKVSAITGTVKKLKRGTTYYFKVKAYRTVNGHKVYGAESSVKSIRR